MAVHRTVISVFLRSAALPQELPGAVQGREAEQPNLCKICLGQEPLLRRAPAASALSARPAPLRPQPMALGEVAACGGADPAPAASSGEASGLCSAAPGSPAAPRPRRCPQHGLGLRGAQRRRAGLARR